MLIIGTHSFYPLHSWNKILCVGVGRRAGWIFIPKYKVVIEVGIIGVVLLIQRSLLVYKGFK